MSEIITRPIGSRIYCDGVELIVVENTSGIKGYCGTEVDPCYFANRNGDGLCAMDCSICGCCYSCSRSDGKDVYFREVKS